MLNQTPDMSVENPEKEKILAKLQNLISRQNGILKEYLVLTGQSATALAGDNLSRLQNSLAAEKKLLKTLLAVQKIINPLEELLENRYGPGSEKNPAACLAALKREQEQLRKRVAAGIRENRKQLSRQADSVKCELQKIKKNPLFRSAFTKESAPVFIDITG